MALGAHRVLGVVLAGGRSTRFGSEKAVAVVGGAPMVARAAAVLARGCEAVAVNARPESGAAAWARSRGMEVLSDAPGFPDGPLAGVLTGLASAQEGGCAWLATAPCDTPWLPADMVGRLIAQVRDAPAAVAVTAEGSHPLCTLWSTSLCPRLTTDLADGAHPSVRAWLREVGAAEVRFPVARAFANLNTAPAPRSSPRRIAAAVLAGLLAWLLTGLGATIAFALAAPHLFPCGMQPLCGGDESPRQLVQQMLIPMMALVAGASAGVWVGTRRRRR